MYSATLRLFVEAQPRAFLTDRERYDAKVNCKGTVGQE